MSSLPCKSIHFVATRSWISRRWLIASERATVSRLARMRPLVLRLLLFERAVTAGPMKERSRTMIPHTTINSRRVNPPCALTAEALLPRDNIVRAAIFHIAMITLLAILPKAVADARSVHPHGLGLWLLRVSRPDV